MGETLVAELRARGFVLRPGASLVAAGPEARALKPAPRLLAFGGEAPDGAYYRAQGVPAIEEIVALVVAASESAADDDAEAELKGRVLELLRRLERQSDADVVIQDIAREARIVADAERAQVSVGNVTAGVTGYAARTGRGVAVDRLADDPRYDASVDGDGARFLAWPLDDTAVLTLARPAHAPPFGEAECRRVQWMARMVAPFVSRLLTARALESRAAARHTAIRADVAQLFRAEALEQYQRGREEEGHLLELEPAWTRRAYPVILAFLAAALLFAALVHVDQFAQGVGVVRGGRVIAALPARHANDLRASMPLRFDLTSQPLTIARVQPTIVASSEVRRMLGADGAALWSATPAVIVEAPLIDRSRFGDGVAARVRVRVGRERLLFALVPALRGRA